MIKKGRKRWREEGCTERTNREIKREMEVLKGRREEWRMEGEMERGRG